MYSVVKETLSTNYRLIDSQPSLTRAVQPSTNRPSTPPTPDEGVEADIACAQPSITPADQLADVGAASGEGADSKENVPVSPG